MVFSFIVLKVKVCSWHGEDMPEKETCEGKEKDMNEVMLISDAAKEVNVENHVLRYWEEELHLPIKRNELGHRYYTSEDVERFKQIKSMKERGLQLKAIKMILKNGKIDILPQENDKQDSDDYETNADSGVHMAIDIVDTTEVGNHAAQDVVGQDEAVQNEVMQNSREDKARRLQWLLQQLIRETLKENNQQLCNDIKESVVKELDYQFRAQEEREEERDRRQIERNEEYYKKMDELLRLKREKKKRHSIF